jgi:flagellar motor protein MotB
MIRNLAILFFLPLLSIAQTVPIYRVTVVERSLQAVNYQYRAGPTEIDFTGTVLLPTAKGHATVESKRGRVEMDVSFKKLTAPTPFGREYLTYVLWAISPEGAPHNICEIVPGGSDSAKVHVSTDLQAFAMIVTAEPYSSVRQPSDVVVLENVVRPDTIGRTETIAAKAELLPRGHYTLDKQAPPDTPDNTPKVSMGEYEQLSQIYQAENAIAMAHTANADALAPDTLAKARQLLDQAKEQRMNKAGVSLVVQTARAASQTADDARVLAQKRAQDQTLTAARTEAVTAQQEKMRAVADAERAHMEADTARTQAAEEHAARLNAEAANSAVDTVRSSTSSSSSTTTTAMVPPPPPPPDNRAAKSQLRISIANQLNASLPTRDTPRGLVVTLRDSDFSESILRPGAALALSRIAAFLARPGLRISVEGYSDTQSGESMCGRRAEAVRDAMAGRSLNITARGFGSVRPLTSNATAAGRTENRRVEIVIAGDPIGDTPVWDRSYTLSLR